jgi:hypothetical protein
LIFPAQRKSKKIKKTLHQRICDQCGKPVESEENNFGRDSFCDWISMGMRLFRDGRNKEIRNFDFCGADCAIKFLKMRQAGKKVKTPFKTGSKLIDIFKDDCGQNT